jgi:non-specific serine/threonine protein kinase/serine/threonine-protein kinase
MTPERWEQIREVLEKALELAPEQRSAYLDSACCSDSSLRKEVEALLADSADVPSGFLQSSAMAEIIRAEMVGIGSVAPLEAGQEFARRFRLIRELGEGGMGQVWLAEQTSPVRRQVALKMIKAGMYDEAVVQRFQSERQSLAIMDHPAIAKVFDAGTTPQGQPYFVMEYVPGLPVTEYCDQKKLAIRNRLELFIETCEGVQHAHQKAILHRDLKPANILVVEVDGKPVPRIIDFGLAKAVTQQIAVDALKTQLGNLVGTPGYMSPEQADATVQDIDTRTDVYSLGVVLYVLLAGREPFENKQGQKQQLDELLRKLREDEPPKPSTRVNGDRHSSNAIAEARSTEPRQLTRLLRGDLDWITMKALEKDRARRYGTPSELSADIRRYLNHEPVLARPASAAYRSGKFVKRHKLALAVASVFAVMALAGAVAIVREAQIARMQEARAERRFESLRRLTNSLLFEFHDSIAALPGSTAARELVVRRALEYLEQIDADAHDNPATLRDLAAGYERLGQIQADEGNPHLGGAGSFEQAKELYDKALDIRQRLASLDPANATLQLELTDTLFNVARIHEQLGDMSGALQFLQQRLAIQEDLERKQASDTLTFETARTLINMGALHVWLGDRDSALAYESRALDMGKRLLKANPNSVQARITVWRSLTWGGWALKFQRRFREAAASWREGLAISEKLASEDPNNTTYQRYLISDHGNLCESLAYAGEFTEVRSHCQTAIGINQMMVNSDRKNAQALADLGNSNMTMGLALYLMHSPQQALIYEQRATSIYQDLALQDPDSLANAVDRSESLLYLGRAEADLHRPELARKNAMEAERLLDELVKRNPQNRYYSDALEEAQGVIKVLPNDTAPLAVH